MEETKREIFDGPVPVSIYATPTKLTGGGIVTIPLKNSAGLATHWSLYVEFSDGTSEWAQDIAIGAAKNAHNYVGDVLMAAAKLSIEHKAYIQPIL